MSDNFPANPVATEIAAIETTMRDRSAYFSDPGLAERYQTLIQAQDSGSPAPARDEAGREIAAIERTIRTDREGYWSNPDMQARYRELLADTAKPTGKAQASRDDGVRETVAIPSSETIEFFRSARGREILDSWRANGGIVTNARDSDTIAIDFAQNLPREIHDDFQNEFLALPVPVQFIIRAELTNSYVSRSGSATSEQMKMFATTPEGADLIEEWGDGARRRIAVVNARAARVFSRLSTEEKAELNYFLNAIPPQGWRAILTCLARAA